MKRCPECRKDYLDDSLLYCLDDGTALVQGTVGDEPATAIFVSEPPFSHIGEETRTARDVGDFDGGEFAGNAASSQPTRRALSNLSDSFSNVISRGRLPWIISGLLAVTLVGWWALGPRMPAPSPVFSLEIAAPPGWTLEPTSALSVDGSMIAFTAENAEGKTFMWVRPVAGGESRMLDGTEGAVAPFWKPDGTAIGFFAENRLRAFEFSNGRSRVICDVSGARKSGSWSTKDVIVFSREAGVPIMKISAVGRAQPETIDGVFGFRPHFLPDGENFLVALPRAFTPQGHQQGIKAVNVASGEVKQLVDDGVEPKHAGGYLFFVGRQRGLYAQPFEPRSVRLSGQPTKIAEIPGRYTGVIGTNYSVSSNGLLVYAPHFQLPLQMAWYTRNGDRTPINEGGNWQNPELSPDETLVALQRSENVIFASGGQGQVGLPMWSHDGRSIRFGREDVGIVEKLLTGGAERTLISWGIQGTETQMTSTDGVIAFFLNEGHRDIAYWPSLTSQMQIFAGTQANETQPSLSPDERWLAFHSDDSIYIEPFPGGGERIKVSGDVAEACQPRWRSDGRELYFLGAEGRLYAVSVEPAGGELKFGIPQELFKSSMLSNSGLGVRAHYDVNRDGSRFITVEPREGLSGRHTITVIVNWKTALSGN
jgi:eukaryotic-like serine/threonine-protein kinase